jgi:hypothetical protein
MSVWDKVGIAGVIAGYNQLKTSINALRVNDDGSIQVNISGGNVVPGGLTNTELRASPVPVSGPGGNPLPVDIGTSVAALATASNQVAELTAVGTIVETAPASDTASSGLNGRLQRIAQRLTSLIALVPAALTGSGNFKVSIAEATATVPVSNASLPLPTGAATAANQATDQTLTGGVTEAAPASDTASSGLNGRLQRIAQRLTSLIALVPAALTGSGNFKVAVVESTATQAISAASLPLPTGAATSANQTTDQTLTGAVTETAPVTDTASSGLNGRLQRIAQRLTSLIAQSPAALGQTTKSGSFAVVLASDDDVQAKLGIVTETAPASDTASSGLNGRLQRVAQRLTSLIALLPTALGANGGLKIEGVASGTAVPVSAASLPLPTGAATSASQATLVTDVGDVVETAPASDTASSGLNGRLQRVAQRLTSILALWPTAAALAEGAASPTTTKEAALNHLWNGATWDFFHANEDVSLGVSGAKTASFNTAAQTNRNARGAFMLLNIGAVSGTSPLLTVNLQWSPDGGTTWTNLGPTSAGISAVGSLALLIYPTNLSQTPGATPTTLTTNASQTMLINAPLPRTWRLAISIGGTTPSFNFNSIFVNYVW